MIKKLSSSHCFAAARLHRRCLPDDFLASLNEDFLVTLYQIFSTVPLAYAYVWVERNKIGGALVGTTDTNSLFKTVFLSYGIKLIMPTIKSLLFNPSTIVRLFETFFYTRNSKSALSAELLVICVAPELQRSGIGSKLIKAFKQDLQHAGIAQFKVSTHRNSDANYFYQSLGGKRDGQFNQYGTIWQTYTIETK